MTAAIAISQGKSLSMLQGESKYAVSCIDLLLHPPTITLTLLGSHDCNWIDSYLGISSVYF